VNLFDGGDTVQVNGFGWTDVVWVTMEIDREESIVLDTADDQTQNRSNNIKNTRGREREREREE